MADFRVEGDAIKKMVKAAKKAPVALAFNPGTGEEDAYLAMHRRKGAEVLGKEARAEGEGGKFTFGPATVEGKVLRLTCLRDLPGTAKKLKKYLKSQKVMLNVVILDADGRVVESDIEDDLPDDPALDGDDIDDGAEEEEAEAPADEEAAPPEAPPGPDPAAAEVDARLARLRDAVAGLAPDAAQQVAVALERIAALRADGEVARAAAGLDKLEPIVARLAQAEAPPPPPPPPPPPQDPRLARLAETARGLRAAAAGLADEKARATVLAALDRVDAHLRVAEVDPAQAILTRLQEVLRSLAPRAPAPRLMPVWAEARDATHDAFDKLQAHLKSSGLPLFERIADKGLHGITQGQFVALQAALMDHDAAPPETRPAAVARLRDATAGMRAFLSENRVLPLLEDNPFGIPVDARATLGQAVDAIDAALAAGSGGAGGR